MAKLIHCEEDDKKMRELAEKHGELYESIKGKALNFMMCDQCGKEMYAGDPCYAAVLLPNKEHFNYEYHKPEVWADDLIEVDRNQQ